MSNPLSKSYQADEAIWRAWAADPSPANEHALARMMRSLALRILTHWLDRDEREVLYELADLAVARAGSHLDSYAADSKFTTWYYKIVRNCYRQWLRDKGSTKNGFGQKQCPLFEQDGVDDLSSLGLYQQEHGLLLRELRESLNGAQLRLFEEKLQGYTDEEICRRNNWWWKTRGNNQALLEWRSLREHLRSLIALST